MLISLDSRRRTCSRRMLANEHEVVAADEIAPAVQVPLAERAEIHDVRGRRIGTVEDAILEAMLDPPVVGLEVADAERCGVTGAENHMHLFRRALLKAGELLAVRRELEDEMRFWSASKLRIDDFITPVAESRREWDLLQEVCVSDPCPVEEDCLVDAVHSCAHGVESVGFRLPQVVASLPLGLDVENAVPTPGEPFDVLLFELGALANDEVGM